MCVAVTGTDAAAAVVTAPIAVSTHAHIPLTHRFRFCMALISPPTSPDLDDPASQSIDV
jgi:hypothetical protein